jgi:hypothetical protein
MSPLLPEGADVRTDSREESPPKGSCAVAAFEREGLSLP